MNKVLLLVAEDEDNYAELLTRRLENLGTQIRRAATLEEAIAQAGSDNKPDMVFLDLRFPDSPQAIQTLDIIPKIKSMAPNAAIIALTGDPDHELPMLARTLGADAFRHKEELAAQKDLWMAMKDALEAQKARGINPSEAGIKLITKVIELLNDPTA